MAYLVLLAMVFIWWFNFILYLDNIVPSQAMRRGGMFEPIVASYVVSLIPVIAPPSTGVK